MRDIARAQTAPGHWLPWGRACVTRSRAGRARPAPPSARRSSTTTTMEPNERAAFLGAMHGLSTLVADEAPRVYDASRHRQLCDVGGSAGTLADGLSARKPGAAGHGVRPAQATCSSPRGPSLSMGSRSAAGAVGGDFFVDVPRGRSLCAQDRSCTTGTTSSAERSSAMCHAVCCLAAECS